MNKPLLLISNDDGMKYMEKMSYRGMVMDICVPQVMIVIHIGDSQEFFDATKKYYAPFFIRETESEKKTLEKIQNCCIMQMRKMHNKLNAKKNKA